MNRKAIAALVAALCITVTPTLAGTRQGQIRSNSTHVMPFSMAATMHVFRPDADGGVMTVMSRRPNSRQVKLIRDHLQKEAAAFASGNYSDPTSIHGKQMPGLDNLKKGFSRVRVTYASVEDGATLTFRSKDKSIIAALHRWFAAQVSDHGHDAMMM